MSRYKYLLFDADDTLFDFKVAEKCAFREALTAIGAEFAEERYALYHSINDALWKALEHGKITRERLKIQRFEEFFSAVGADVSLSEDMAAAYVEALSHQRFPMPEAEETLRRLAGKYGIYIVTNGLTYIQRGRLHTSVFEGLVDKMFVSEEIGAAKPSPVFFEQVTAEIGDGDLTRYLIIGDSLTADIDGGISFGIDTCHYDPENKGSGGRAVTYRISRLSQVCGILEE